MRVLVTGSQGQLGRSLQRLVGERKLAGWDFTDVNEDGAVKALDITDAEAVESKLSEGYDAVVNCAAWTDVERAESTEALAQRLNGDAPGILGRSCAKHGVRMIHVSTDYVFGGLMANRPIGEGSPLSPLGAYGRTKADGERQLEESGAESVILRTAWLYSEYGKNFVKTMQGLMGSREEIRVVSDQLGTPTYAGNLASAIIEILGKPETKGVYHFTDEGTASWYDFAVAIQELSGLGSCRVLPCRTEDYPTKAERPAYSVLDKGKIKAALGRPLPHWRASLRGMIEGMTEKE